MTKYKPIEILIEELKNFEKEDIPKVMNRYQCQNCGSLSENLEIKKADSQKQIERFQEILNLDGFYVGKRSGTDSIMIRMAYVTCPICKFRKSFEIYKNIKE